MHHVVLQTGVGNRWVSGCGMDDPFPTIPAAAWSTSISSDSVRAAIRGVATWAEFDTRTAPSYDYCQPFHCLCTHWYHHEPRGLPGHHRREAELTLFLLPFAASAESKLQIMEQNGALRMPHITRLHFLSHPRQPFLFSFPTFVLVIIVIMTSRRTKSNNLRCVCMLITLSRVSSNFFWASFRNFNRKRFFLKIRKKFFRSDIKL